MKRNYVIALAIVALLGAGIGGGYWLAMHRMMSQMNAQASAPARKQPLYWHDPMYPQQRFDKPGKSPFMDMQLVPVYTEGEGDQGSVTISSRVQQNLGVRTAEVTVGTLTPVIEAVGSVAYNERDVAVVQARANGFVEKLHVRAPLDPVRKDAPLAELLIPDWVAAQEEYLALNRMTGSGLEALRDGAIQRMRLAGMTEEQIRNIESTGKVHPRTTIVAPIGGVVTELTAREGMTVMSGAPLFRINGLGTVWVNAEVPENAAAQVRPGTPVEARTPALPGITFKGKVGAILPEVNPTTRTLKTRIELANPNGQLIPGMFVTVNLTPVAREEALLVPTEAVIQTGKRTVVVVADTVQDGKQQFLPVDVEIGAEANGMTEIRKGLARSQKVVVSGQFLIDSESSLKATATRLAEAPGSVGLTHSAEGRVEKIGKDAVTISHGPVPSLQWGAMTMDFKVPNEGVPAGVKEGGMVSFEFKSGGKGEFEITAIRPIPAAMGTKGGAKR